MSSNDSFSSDIDGRAGSTSKCSTTSHNAPSVGYRSRKNRGTIRRKLSHNEDDCQSRKISPNSLAQDTKLSLDVISYRTFQCPVNDCQVTLSCSAVSIHFQREHPNLIGVDMIVGTQTELSMSADVRTSLLKEKVTPIKILFLRDSHSRRGPVPFLVNSALFQTKTESLNLKWLLVWLSSPYNFKNWFSVKLHFQTVFITQACRPLAMQFEYNLQEIFDDDNVLIAHLPSTMTSFDLKRHPFLLEISVHSAET